MEQKLLAVKGNLPCDINIGDYIQALATSQFIKSPSSWVERELLKSYDGGACKIIMNAWFMHNSNEWPPSENINPLFLSTHINSNVIDRFTEEDSLLYLKEHEPIGCRDEYTAIQLQEKGIKAYFSGCMTLTLGYKYKTSNRSNKTYIVDPFFRIKERPLSWKIKAMFAFMRNPITINKIRKKRIPKQSLSIGQILDAAWFFKRYSEVFSKQVLLDSEYINHEMPNYQKYDNDELLKIAECLIKKYSEASLVITSRIHCALPCTALGVPVIYIEDKNLPEDSKCRLNGLRNLFNVIIHDKTKLIPQFEIKGKISSSNYPALKTNYMQLAERLIAECESFFKL